jgi:hypothetical protein
MDKKIAEQCKKDLQHIKLSSAKKQEIINVIEKKVQKENTFWEKIIEIPSPAVLMTALMFFSIIGFGFNNYLYLDSDYLLLYQVNENQQIVWHNTNY